MKKHHVFWAACLIIVFAWVMAFGQESEPGKGVSIQWGIKIPVRDGIRLSGSYAGFDQWTVLKEFPVHLVTIVPAAAVHPGVLEIPAVK